MNLYQIIGTPLTADRQRLGFVNGWRYYRYEIGNGISVRAIATGEIRCPKAGEWHVSGKEVYCAGWDLCVPKPIAELVLVKDSTGEIVNANGIPVSP